MKPTGFFGRVKTYALAHKVISGIVIIVLLGGGYWVYKKAHPAVTQTYYVMGTATDGTIVEALDESGDVSTTNTVNIEPQVSGQITWVGMTAGQQVAAGQVLATIDDTQAQQQLTQAEQSLTTDQLQYQQNAAQAPITYQNDQTAVATDQENLNDDYNNTYNDLVTTYLDLPNVVSGAQDAIYGYDFDPKKVQWNKDVLANLFTGQENTTDVEAFESSATTDYTSADNAYEAALAIYEDTPRTASTTAIDNLLSQSITMETGVAQDLQDELNFFGAVSDLAQTYNITLPSKFSTIQSQTSSYLSTANSDLSTLLNDKKTIDNEDQTITNDQQTITLDQVGNPTGSNPITLQEEQNTIQQDETTITNDKTNLSYYTIVAPFAGTISSVSAQVGQNASGNLATIVSQTQIAQLSVNEVDAAKIQDGDNVTLTFDAIPNLTLTGTISEINTVGTVSQGVVSYEIDVSFDTQDPRVLPGMTVNAAIQTSVAQDTLLVPAGAIKTAGTQSYVLAFNPPIATSTITAAGSQGITTSAVPVEVPVVTGITDDTNMQILSGLTLGQQIVTSTHSSGTATPTAAAAATSRVGGAGGGFGGGGGAAVRI